ncbi:MAG: hypothetical protein E7479_03555 [Ruminococcaceae bacterium]|nr:hypothetical protein [Oscillospiraceae bacterium]
MEIIILGISILLFVIALLCDISFLSVFKFLTLKFSNKDDLLLALFGVQASVSTISIAIVTLIAGVFSESAYGVSFSKFIFNIKPWIFKHNRLIIGGLLITVANYFFIAFNYYNVSLVMFLLSIIISIVLVKDTCVIFLGKKELKKQIKEFIENNYTDKNLLEIENYLLKNGGIDNFSIFEENIELIKAIYTQEISKIKNGVKSSKIEQIENIFVNIFTSVLKKENPKLLNYILINIYDLYEIANEQNNTIVLNLWDDISFDFFKAIKILLSYPEFKKGLIYRFHAVLCDNQKIETKNGKEKILNCFDLKYYSMRAFAALRQNESGLVLDSDRRYTIPMLYRGIIDSLDDKLYENQTKRELVIELCYFIKILVDSGEKEALKKLYFNSGRQNYPEYYKISFVAIMAYLYYVSRRECLVADKPVKKHSEEIIKENQSVIKYIFQTIDFAEVIKNHFKIFYNLLDQWEEFPDGQAKWVIFDTVLKDFIIFVALIVCKNYNEDVKYYEISEIIDTINISGMFSLYNSFFGNNKFDTYFPDFKDLFFGLHSKKDYENEINVLHEIFVQKYKEEELLYGEKEKITVEYEKIFEENIKKTINTLIESHSKVFDNISVNIKEENSIDTIDKYETKDILLCTGIFHNFTINKENLETSLSSTFVSHSIYAYVKSIYACLLSKELNYKEKNKQQQFINLLEANGVSGDTVIGEASTFSFWREDDKDLLNKYTSNMDKIEYPDGINSICVIESSAVHFSMFDIKVVFSNLEKEEIMHQCKIDEEKGILYNVTNDIFIPFSKEELIKHINNIQKRVSIYATIKYKLDKKIVGAILNINYDDSDSNEDE